jgi:hypothetical protein
VSRETEGDERRCRRHEQDVGQVIAILNEISNPFDGSHEELVNIMSGVIASVECTEDMRFAYENGEKTVSTFLNERLFEKKKDFFDTIPRSKSMTFASQKRQDKSKGFKAPDSDRKMFSRLLLLSKSKGLDLKNVMKYSLGNVSYPLASEDGGLSTTPKSKLRDHLISKYHGCVIPDAPTESAVIIDAMGVIQGLAQRSLPSTWKDLAEKVFSICKAKASDQLRLDIVFDRDDNQASIKCITHQKRELEIPALEKYLVLIRHCQKTGNHS